MKRCHRAPHREVWATRAASMIGVIQPESWDGFLSRLEFVRGLPLRWAWIAIRQGDVWKPYSISVRVQGSDEDTRNLQNDQIWLFSGQATATHVGGLLARHMVDESREIAKFGTQESYSSYWIPPGIDYGFGRVSDWPQYYTCWPMGDAANLRIAVQWQSPFRSEKAQFKTTLEACATVMFGQRSLGRQVFQFPDGITMRLPYPYRLSGAGWHDGRFSIRADWSRGVEIPGVNLHINWRTSAEQIEPNQADLEIEREGGELTFPIDTTPVEVELFLNDPSLPVPVHEVEWVPVLYADRAGPTAGATPSSSGTEDKEAMESEPVPQWNVFISYAGEDKQAVADPLHAALRDAGLAVWYSDTALKLGDSLRKKIDEGLARSRFGVVILSQSFFKKKWPQKELDGLVAREREGVKVVLPVWYGLTVDQLEKYSPTLAGVIGIEWERGIGEVLREISDVVGRGTREASNDVKRTDGSYRPEVDAETEFAKAKELIADSDLARLEMKLDDLVQQVTGALAAGDTTRANDHLQVLSAYLAAAIAYLRAAPFPLANRLPDTYNRMLSTRALPADHKVSWGLTILEHIDALGALALRRRNWKQVRELGIQKVTGEDDPEVAYVMRHAQLTWARCRRDRSVSILHNAHERVKASQWLRIDALPEDRRLLDSLCQFDLVAGLLILSDARQSTKPDKSFWPEFARFPNKYSEPVLDVLITDAGARLELGFTSERELAQSMVEVNDLASNESFAPYGGWVGFQSRAVLKFVLLLNQQPPGILG